MDKRRVYQLSVLLIALTLAFASVGKANASIMISIMVTANGNNIEGQSVPITTEATVTGTYGIPPTALGPDGAPDESLCNFALGIMAVWHKTSPNDPWTFIEILFMGIIPEGSIIVETYSLDQLGYYKFTWTVAKICEIATVRTKVGPVVSEPASLAALGLSLAVIGTVFFYKKPKKSEITPPAAMFK